MPSKMPPSVNEDHPETSSEWGMPKDRSTPLTAIGMLRRTNRSSHAATGTSSDRWSGEWRSDSSEAAVVGTRTGRTDASVDGVGPTLPHSRDNRLDNAAKINRAAATFHGINGRCHSFFEHRQVPEWMTPPRFHGYSNAAECASVGTSRGYPIHNGERGGARGTFVRGRDAPETTFLPTGPTQLKAIPPRHHDGWPASSSANALGGVNLRIFSAELW